MSGQLRVSDLTRALLQHKPHIVHFSGHGTKTNGIVLEDRDGESAPVNKQALARLFKVLRDNIRVVVMNACYAEDQAKSLQGLIDYTIGMSAAIRDDAAITFSTYFYQALVFGRSVREAFDLALIQLDFEAIAGSDVPRLLVRDGVDESVSLLDVPTASVLEQIPKVQHALHQFPKGPLVKFNVITHELVSAFATLLNSQPRATGLINKANQLREAADPDDQGLTVVQFSYLPLMDHVGAYDFWQAVFMEGCKNGPRMIAALLLAQPDDMFDPAARRDRARILQVLSTMKDASS